MSLFWSNVTRQTHSKLDRERICAFSGMDIEILSSWRLIPQFPLTAHRHTVDNGNCARSSWRMIMTMTAMMMNLLEFMCCLNLIYISWTHINCLQQLSVEISMINWLKCWDFFPCAAVTENPPARRQPDFRWWKSDFFYFCFIFVPCELHHVPFVARLSKQKKVRMYWGKAYCVHCVGT